MSFSSYSHLTPMYGKYQVVTEWLISWGILQNFWIHLGSKELPIPRKLIRSVGVRMQLFV